MSLTKHEACMDEPQLQSLQIELTARCNERCVHCSISHESKTRDMDTALLFSLLDQCSGMGVEQITISGGEPMLPPHFLEAVSKAGGVALFADK
jgi:MoaA/NifB/PqqE/SkfB family radical SAM enzyme